MPLKIRVVVQFYEDKNKVLNKDHPKVKAYLETVKGKYIMWSDVLVYDDAEKARASLHEMSDIAKAQGAHMRVKEFKYV